MSTTNISAGTSTGVLRTGIEQGVFRDVDGEDMLRLITDVIYAARARKIALGYDDAPKQVQRAINEFVFSSFALLPTTPTSIAPSTV